MTIGFISNNSFSVVLGISMVIICFLIAYMAQKHWFSKYRNKVKSTVEKDERQS